MNADGFGDLAVGAPGQKVQGCFTDGDAYLFLGNESPTASSYRDAAYTVGGLEETSGTGCYISGVGDLNRDGIDDMAIGSPGYAQGNGRVDILFGNATTGATWTPNHVLVVQLGLDAGTDARLGPVVDAGDLNGDGFDDLVISAPGMSNNRGMLFIRFGPLDAAKASMSITSDASASFIGEEEGTQFGARLGAGMLTDDDCSDLLVGAPLLDSDQGAIYLLAGRTGTEWGWNRSAAAASAFWTGDSEGQGVGSAMVLADANGDGWIDLLSGAPGDNTRGERAGAVYGFLW